MKKIIALLLIAVMACGIFAGCGGKSTLTITNGIDEANIYLVTMDGKKEVLTPFTPEAEYEKGTVLNLAVKRMGNNIVDEVKVNGTKVELTDYERFSVTVDGETKVDITYYDRATDPELAARREKVVAYAYENVSTLFMYDKDLSHQRAGRDWSLKANTLYRGVPYNNGNISTYGYLQNVAYTDENGINHMDTSKYLPQWGVMLGANCCDLVYWAWSQVSDTITTRFASETTEYKGALKIGEYDFDRKTYSDTKLTCAENDIDVMFEAYSYMLPGDGMVNHFNGAGHVILVSDIHVEYEDDGAIDPDKSYILYHDTHGSYHEVTVEVGGQEVKATATNNVNEKSSFQSLFGQGYLPVAPAELIYRDEPVDAATIEDSEAGNLSKDTVTKGVIKCNYYMDVHTMEITDAAGNLVQKAVRHSNEQDHKDYDLSLFTSRRHDDWGDDYQVYTEDDLIDLSKLPAGNYHCKLTTHVGTGESIVVRDFDFTI